MLINRQGSKKTSWRACKCTADATAAGAFIMMSRDPGFIGTNSIMLTIQGLDKVYLLRLVTA